MQTVRSLWEKLALAVCSEAWSMTGWWITLSGGFTKSYRLTTTTTYIDRALVEATTFLFFVLSALAAWVAVQSWNPTRLVYAVIAEVALGASTIYVFRRQHV